MLLEQNFHKVAHKINRGESVSLAVIRAGTKSFHEWSKASFFPLCLCHAQILSLLRAI